MGDSPDDCANLKTVKTEGCSMINTAQTATGASTIEQTIASQTLKAKAARVERKPVQVEQLLVSREHTIRYASLKAQELSHV